MKTAALHQHPRRRASGMTLVELMVSSGVLVLVVAATISVNLFGMRQDELINSKMGASDQARQNFNLLLDEIRSGKNVQIGTGWNTGFVPITNGPQQGDTIQIIPGTNSNVCIYYYFLTNAPTNSSWLMRVYSTPTNSITNVVATCITNVATAFMTNALMFQAIAYNGTNFAVLTNDPTVYSTHNYLVNIQMQFYQFQFPLTRVGPNYLYDYYQINLQAARRAP